MIKNSITWSRYIYFVCLSLLAALGNIGVVYTINRIVNDYFTNTPIVSNQYLLYFIYAIALFVICRWIFSLGIIRLTQSQLHATRLKVLRMVLRSSYTNLIKNKSQVFTVLTRDTDNVVGASVNLVDIMTNGIIVIVCFIYMGVLSWKLLMCIIGLMGFTLLIYTINTKRAEKYFRQAMEQNDYFIKYLSEILKGFKEICIEPSIGSEIAHQHIDKAISNLSAFNQRAHITFLNNRIIGQIAFYIFIGSVLLFLGNIFGIEKGVLVNFTFLVLYIWGPIETVVVFIPTISQARTSMKRIEKLEQQINESHPLIVEHSPFTSFVSLSVKDISYQYVIEEGQQITRGFDIGKIDFNIKKGDAIFICGGNGSGKTTFINILTGLIQPDTGGIFINNSIIKHTQSTGYKSLFAPLFSDFHLFDAFYSIPEIDYNKADEYLKLFEVDKKVSIEKGKFSDINVSTGQRKRLALISAMLEKKPILVIDEFAADQDPGFKKKFYKEIIPFIKKEGYTLIIITHDDNYYQYADKLYKMDSGKLYEMTIEQQPVIA